MMENFEASLGKPRFENVFVHGKNHARKKASLENGSWVIDFSLAVSSTETIFFFTLNSLRKSQWNVKCQPHFREYRNQTFLLLLEA